jgi:hypothetical protein
MLNECSLTWLGREFDPVYSWQADRARDNFGISVIGALRVSNQSLIFYKDNIELNFNFL